MDTQHPVPQNVTSFQFHLVGDMTLKQFLYLAAGVGIAYLFFVLVAQIAPIVAWPIIIISAFSGIAFAFLPISDRPLDHWVGAFLHAIFQPTKRIWIKNNKKYSDPNELPIFQNRFNYFMNAPQVPITPPPSPPQPPQPQSIKAPVAPNLPQPSQTQPQPQTTNPPLPSSGDLSKTVRLAHEAQALQVKIIEKERELNQIKTEASTPGGSLKSYTSDFNNVFNGLQTLVQEASQIKQELSTLTNEPTAPLNPVKISVVVPTKQRLTQLVLTTFPNVINGVIIDAQGNYLEGVVVVIHDRDGLPVRALKSNKLGQFTGSTPLPNGVYTVEMEKDSLMFDVLQIDLTGQVLPPIKIAAKQVVRE